MTTTPKLPTTAFSSRSRTPYSITCATKERSVRNTPHFRRSIRRDSRGGVGTWLAIFGAILLVLGIVDYEIHQIPVVGSVVPDDAGIFFFVVIVLVIVAAAWHAFVARAYVE
jgi:hypothetical protein